MQSIKELIDYHLKIFDENKGTYNEALHNSRFQHKLEYFGIKKTNTTERENTTNKNNNFKNNNYGKEVDNNWAIGQMSRVFANSLVQSQVELYQRLKNGTWCLLA